MPDNRARKKAARDLAEWSGLSYDWARRNLDRMTRQPRWQSHPDYPEWRSAPCFTEKSSPYGFPMVYTRRCPQGCLGEYTAVELGLAPFGGRGNADDPGCDCFRCGKPVCSNCERVVPPEYESLCEPCAEEFEIVWYEGRPIGDTYFGIVRKDRR